MNTIFQAKCYFLAVIFLLISFSNVFAQQNDTKPCSYKKEIFAFGPKLSVNVANECHKRAYKTKFTPGADLGLFFRFSPGRLYIQPEINYHIRNTKDVIIGMEEPYIKYETHHLDIPVLIGIKVIDFKFLKLRFFAGPEFNMRFKGYMDDYFHQLGIIAGLGVDVWRFTVDASYSFLGYIYPHRTLYNRSNVFKVGIGFKCF